MPELLLLVHRGREHLVALLRIRGVVVEPDRAGIAASLEDHAAARLDIQHGLLPVYAVARLGIAG